MEELKRDICLYFKVFGLGQDEDGKPCDAGMKIDLGRAKKEVSYEELQKKVLSTPDWREQVLRFAHLNEAEIKTKDIALITPEEYERDYGDDGDKEEDKN